MQLAKLRQRTVDVADRIDATATWQPARRQDKFE
jgi:hypothetical protein